MFNVQCSTIIILCKMSLPSGGYKYGCLLFIFYMHVDICLYVLYACSHICFMNVKFCVKLLHDVSLPYHYIDEMLSYSKHRNITKHNCCDWCMIFL